MLNELKSIFESNIKALEILYMLKGIKTVARLMVKEEKKEKILTFLKEKEFHYEISDFKIIKQDTNKAYSDKGIKVPINSQEQGHFFVYISKDKEKAKKAKELEANDKHKELGILLGYPKCCAEFFEQHYPEESKKNSDFTLATLKNSNGFQFPFYTNIAARHFDVALLSHFPCNFNCQASIELAKKHLEIIKRYDKQSAEITERMLKGAILYTETNGVFLLKYPRLEYDKLYYKGIMASIDNQLCQSLKNVNHIEIINKNRIRLDNFDIKNIGVMLFF